MDSHRTAEAVPVESHPTWVDPASFAAAVGSLGGCQVAASGTPNGVRRVISVEDIEPPRHEFLPCRAA